MEKSIDGNKFDEKVKAKTGVFNNNFKTH